MNDGIESDDELEDNYGFDEEGEDDDDSNEYDQNHPSSIES